MTEAATAPVWYRVLVAIRSSFIVFAATSGLVLFLAGVALRSGVTAGLLTIVGAFFVAYGVVGSLMLRLIGYSA
jgi:hypothetical protein